jgi:hypothetical protein
MTGRTAERLQIAGAFGLGLLSLGLRATTASRPTAPLAPLSVCKVPLPPRCSPSERARRAGWHYRIRAMLAENLELDALEEWDPDVMEGPALELWRRQLMARDRGGDLRQARRTARQAAALARNPGEAYRAASLLANLACDAGAHQTELKQARKMMALQPHSQASLAALWHAAGCNGMEPLACRAMVALRLLRESQEQAISVPGSVAGVGHLEAPAASPRRWADGSSAAPGH